MKILCLKYTKKYRKLSNKTIQMYCLENEITLERNNSMCQFIQFKDDFEESIIKGDYEIHISSPKGDEEFEEFFLFQECGDVPASPIPSSALNPTKDYTTFGDDQDYQEDEMRSEVHSSEHTHIQVSFDGTNPNMDDFQYKVREEITFRGLNEIICEALEIKNEEDFFLDSPQLIRVKKRKSKEQLKALEVEFAKNDDWSKEFMNELAKKLKLDASQVYKWHWDQISKKLGKAPKRTAKKEKAKLENNNKRKRADPKTCKNKKPKTA